MKQVMFTREDVQKFIQQGQHMLLAADERVLSQLPQGEWIGEQFRILWQNKAASLPRNISMSRYSRTISLIRRSLFTLSKIDTLYTDIPENGVGFILMHGCQLDTAYFCSEWS